MAIIVEAGAHGFTGGLELTHKTAIRNSNSDANQNFNFPFQFLSLIICRSTRGRVWGLFISHAGQSSQEEFLHYPPPATLSASQESVPTVDGKLVKESYILSRGYTLHTQNPNKTLKCNSTIQFKTRVWDKYKRLKVYSQNVRVTNLFATTT